jgi:hypothetical protein
MMTNGGGMSDPRDVLAAVRRMEAELERVRMGAVHHEPTIAEVRAELTAQAATERRAIVEDLELLLNVMEAGWRRTNDEITRLSAQVAELREHVIESRDAIAGARLEVRLGTPRPPSGRAQARADLSRDELASPDPDWGPID